MRIGKATDFSIFQRLLFTSLVILILVIAFVTGILYSFSSRYLRNNATEILVGQFDSIQKKFQHELVEKISSDLRLASKSPSLDNYLTSSPPEKEINSRILEQYFTDIIMNIDNYVRVYFVDYRGREKIKVSKAGRCRDYRDFNGDELFARIENGGSGEIHVGLPHLDQEGQYVFSAGIYKTDLDTGEFGGALFFDCKFDDFLEFLDKTALFGSNSVWVFTPEGKVLKKPGADNTIFDPGSYLGKEPQREPRLLKNKDSIIIYEDLFFRSDEPFIRLALSVPHAIFLKDIKLMFELITAISLFTIILTSIIIYHLSKSISRPIMELAQATTRVATGDYDARVKVKTSREVRMLVDSFNQMSEDIQRNNQFKNLINRLLKITLRYSSLDKILEYSIVEITSLPWLEVDNKGAIFLLEGSPETLVLKAERNLDKALIAMCTKVPLGVCLCGVAAQTREIMFSDKLDKRHERRYAGMEDHGHYCVPIISAANKKVLGVLNLYLKENAFQTRKEEASTLLAMAGVLANIIERQRSEEEKKNLEQRFQQAQKMEAIGTLAGGIAHDFNNLLMSIQGYASLMLMEIDSGHPFYERLKQIEKNIYSGAELTSQLLGFARGGKYETIPTDLNDLLEKSARMFGRTKKEITIRTNFQAGLWTVEIDRSQIEQVLLNLFVNASQAMPEGGEIYLETSNFKVDKRKTRKGEFRADKYVKFLVADTGIGMDLATQEKIFDPFFTTKDKGHGTGLGLASVYGIIKNHGGYINVNSEPGKGAIFNIYLPASDKSIRSTDIILSDELLTGSETILVVDDEELVVDVVTTMLESLGYHVLTALSGEEALVLYKKYQDEIKLVILDMIMPRMSGGEIFNRLKATNPQIKVLLASGYAINGQAEEIMKRGCQGFIQKPFTLNKLSQKIKNILSL